MPAGASTPYAILGLLRFGPMSGYDIHRELEEETAFFWSESYGQIYPALRSLSARRWAKMRRAPTPGRGARGRRERRVYAITARGRKAFDEWLRIAPRPSPPRQELLLKLFLADREFLDAPEAWIQDLLEAETERLRILRRLQGQIPRGDHRHPNVRFWAIALEYVERQSEGAVAWCQKTLATLALLQQAQARRRAAAHRRLLFE
ncbi:MAG: PadR family transcriptional regulator [Candidatus Eiseniibacteriota bacterium]